MRIVLDGNIVRAAWKADGLASRLLRRVLEGPHRPIVSPFILGEVRVFLPTAIAGRAEVICTRDLHLLAPEVVEHCQRHAVRIMDDIDL